MGRLGPSDTPKLDFASHEVTGAIGDSVTVLPIVVAIGALTDLSLPLILLWFGLFQVVWGLYYGVPISVEPMKALAALLIAGTITTAEFLLAGLALGVVLLGLGMTRTLARVQGLIGDPVVRGIQFGVALVLLETGVGLGLETLPLTALAAAIVLLSLVAGYGTLGGLLVLAFGALLALAQTGVPAPAVPTAAGIGHLDPVGLTLPALDATLAQLGMTVGNAALATSVLLADYFDREISPDALAGSMGVTNLLAVPLGGIPMCHGSGGVAGKYAFGARTAGANVILGVGYVLAAFVAVDIVTAFPLALLGVILIVVAGQLGRTALGRTDDALFVVAIGVVGLLANLGLALVLGVLVDLGRRRLRRWE